MIGVSVHLLLEPFFNNTLTWLVLGVATANIIISRGDHRYGRIPVSQDFKEELELSLSGYLSTLYRMRFLILLVMISAGVFAYYYSRTLVPQYEAVAQFYIPDDATRSGRAEGELPVAPIPSGNRDGVTAAVSLLRTDELRRRVNELVPEKPFAELDLDVDPVVERSSMVLVYARDADPQVAAKVANSYYYAFVNFVQQQQSAQQAVALERTLARLAELDAEIERSAQSDRDRMVRLLGLRETLTDTQRNLEKQALSMSEIAIMASPATPPVGPVFPIMPLNVVVSMIAGLVLGILYVVLIDHVRMSRRRRRHLQLEQETIVQDILSDLAPAKFIRS
ncbi:Wzz/FepE/Etk N-terminal domain-containing protein [Albidovulum sp.]|uniref:Wzz/FepE/Etk N-terminal domain-containing protein n=1 Tax=Albidovulum sp. TaxID=1872424 RepID=UPI0035277725